MSCPSVIFFDFDNPEINVSNSDCERRCRNFHIQHIWVRINDMVYTCTNNQLVDWNIWRPKQKGNSEAFVVYVAGLTDWSGLYYTRYIHVRFLFSVLLYFCDLQVEVVAVAHISRRKSKNVVKSNVFPKRVIITFTRYIYNLFWIYRLFYGSLCVKSDLNCLPPRENITSYICNGN